MAVPTSITDCNATAANNSPAGSDSIGTSLDDYLRAHAAIIRQAYDELVVVDGTLLPKAGGSVTGTITTTHQIKGITPVADEDLARKDYVDSIISSGNTSSGTYTPTATSSSNANTVSAGVASWSMVGSNVTIAGTVTFTSPSTALSIVTVTMPFAVTSVSSNGSAGVVNDSTYNMVGYVAAYNTSVFALYLPSNSGSVRTVRFVAQLVFS